MPEQPQANSSFCIIGAGPGGLSMAHYLKKRGYKNITILERQYAIGGKCYTKNFHGRNFDMGANYLTPDYKHILQMAEDVDAKLYSEKGPIVWQREQRKFISQLRAVTASTTFFDFAVAAIRYYFIRRRLRKVLPEAGNGGLAKHPDLMLNFADWLKENNLGPLYNLFCIPVTMMGYGYLEAIPAPYVLRYIGTGTFLTMLLFGAGLPSAFPKRFVEGFQRFWMKVSWQFDVRTGVDIHRITRDENGITAEYDIHITRGETNPVIKRTDKFDYLIVTCPPIIEKLSFMELSEEEQALFGGSRIRHNNFGVLTIDVKVKQETPSRVFSVFPLAPIGYPGIFAHQFPDNPAMEFYAPLHQDDTEEESQSVVTKRCLELIREVGGEATDADVLNYDAWDYFYHVSLEDFKSGYFDRLEALQGANRTYYAGGFPCFELIEPIAAYARQLAETHF